MAAERVSNWPENIHLDSSKQASLIGSVLAVAGRGLVGRTISLRTDVDIRDNHLLSGHSHTVDIDSYPARNRQIDFRNFRLRMAWLLGMAECSTTTAYKPTPRIGRRVDYQRLAHTQAGIVWKGMTLPPLAGVEQPYESPIKQVPSDAAFEAAQRIIGAAGRSPLASSPWELHGAHIKNATMLIEPDRFIPAAGETINEIGALLVRGANKEDKYIGARIAVDIGSPGFVWHPPRGEKTHIIKLEVVDRRAKEAMRFKLCFGRGRTKKTNGLLGVTGELQHETFGPTSAFILHERLHQYGRDMRVVRTRRFGSKGSKLPLDSAAIPVPRSGLIDMLKRVIAFADVRYDT